jgi:hemolysin type calcium-binding protein
VLLVLAFPAAGGTAALTSERCEVVEAGPPGAAGNVLRVEVDGELGVYRSSGGRIRLHYVGPRCPGPVAVGDVDRMVLAGSPVELSEAHGRFAPDASGSEIEIHVSTERLEYAGTSGDSRIGAATLSSGQVALDLDGRPGGQPEYDLFADRRPVVLRVAGGRGDDLIDARRLTGMGDPQLHRRTRLEGNAGDDTLLGSPEVEWRLKDGGGDDLVRTGGGDDEISLGRGRDTVHGGAGDDVISYDVAERFTGTPPDARDRLFAGQGNDLLSDLNRHSDLIRCGPGRDHVAPERHDLPAADCEH